MKFLWIMMTSCTLASAHDVISTRLTWSREVSRIVYKRCAGCHREGGKGPMSLLDYADARPWAKAIKEEVLERRMPPWGAVKGFGEFQHDRGLSQEEIGIIADWVEGGAPEGDPKLLPGKPSPNPPASPKLQGPQLALSGAARLPVDTLLRGIQPKSVSEASVRVYAERPDGSIEPLLWLKNYKPEWRMAYEYAQPVVLPKGTQIRVVPPGGAAFLLFR